MWGPVPRTIVHVGRRLAEAVRRSGASPLLASRQSRSAGTGVKPLVVEAWAVGGAARAGSTMAGMRMSALMSADGEAGGDDDGAVAVEEGVGADGVFEEFVAEGGEGGGDECGDGDGGQDADVEGAGDDEDDEPVPEVGAVGDLAEVDGGGGGEDPFDGAAVGGFERDDEHAVMMVTAMPRSMASRCTHEDATIRSTATPAVVAIRMMVRERVAVVTNAGSERDEGAGEELVGAGVGAVVGAVGIGVPQRQRPELRMRSRRR